MKKIAFILCFVLMVLTLSACGQNNPGSENGKGSDSLSSEVSNNVTQASSSISWHNLSKDTEGLSEREQIIVDFFDNDYILVHDFLSLTKYANIYEKAKIGITPVVIAKIIYSDKERYEAIAIYPDDAGSYLEGNDDYSLDGKNFIFVTGNQPPDGTLVAEHENLLVYGRYHGMIQKEVDGKTLNMAFITEDRKGAFTGNGWTGTDIFTTERAASTAKAIFNNEVKLETCVEGGGHYISIVATPNNQSNADIQSFILGGYGNNFYPVNRNLLAINTSGGSADYDLDSSYDAWAETKYKSCSVSADFNHLILTTLNQSLKKVYIDYYEIGTFNRVWMHEFDGVDVMAYDYTVENMYLIIDDKLHIISLNDGSAITDPIFVGQVGYISVQPDGILLLKLGTGDNITKLDLDGNNLWNIKVEGIEIGDTYRQNERNFIDTGIQNTGNHYVIIANSMQRLAVSFDGNVLVKEGNIMPSQQQADYQAEADAYNAQFGEFTGYAYVCANDGLNLRSEPSTNSQSLAVLPFDTIVEYIDDYLYGSDRSWMYVRVIASEGTVLEGYVNAVWLTPIFE